MKKFFSFEPGFNVFTFAAFCIIFLGYFYDKLPVIPMALFVAFIPHVVNAVKTHKKTPKITFDIVLAIVVFILLIFYIIPALLSN